MGGYNSGPYSCISSRVAKTATNSCLALDIRRFKRYDLLYPGYRLTTTWAKKQSSIGITVLSSDLIVLNYTCTIDGASTPVEDPVRIAYSQCNYGNQRPWFRCPGCNKQVALLYQKGGGVYFRCRHCHDLTYYSCQESGNLNDMAIRRINKALRKLKSEERCSFDILGYIPERPRYMHRKTYHRLLKRYDRKRMEYAASVRAKIESLGGNARHYIDLPDGF